MAKVVPTKPADAKRFVKVAFAARRYEFDTGGHLLKRMAERKLTKDDLTHAIDKLVRIAEYPGSQPWATSWRVIGPDLAGKRIGVGVKLYLDQDDEWALCVTIIDDIE